MSLDMVVDFGPVGEGESDSFSYTKVHEEPPSIERVESNWSTG